MSEPTERQKQAWAYYAIIEAEWTMAQEAKETHRMTCPHCGDSGVLDIIVTIDLATGDEDLTPYTTWCHECPAGAAWREAGLT